MPRHHLISSSPRSRCYPCASLPQTPASMLRGWSMVASSHRCGKACPSSLGTFWHMVWCHHNRSLWCRCRSTTTSISHTMHTLNLVVLLTSSPIFVRSSWACLDATMAQSISQLLNRRPMFDEDHHRKLSPPSPPSATALPMSPSPSSFRPRGEA